MNLHPLPTSNAPPPSWPARAYSAHPGELVHPSNSLRSHFRSTPFGALSRARTTQLRCLGGKLHAHAHARRFFSDATNCDKTVVETPRRRQSVTLIGVYVGAMATRHAHIACISTSRLWARISRLGKSKSESIFHSWCPATNYNFWQFKSGFIMNNSVNKTNGNSTLTILNMLMCGGGFSS